MAGGELPGDGGYLFPAVVHEEVVLGTWIVIEDTGIEGPNRFEFAASPEDEDPFTGGEPTFSRARAVATRFAWGRQARISPIQGGRRENGRLARNPPGLEGARELLRNFHSRTDPGELWEAEWVPPPEMWAVGTGQVIYYSSDKIDPDDAEDPGGVWKGYYHDHLKDTLVYLTPAKAKVLLKGGRALDIVRPEWPEVLTWLGSADGYRMEVKGKELTRNLSGKKGLTGLQLWSFPSPRYIGGACLVAAPAQGGSEAQTVLWAGPNLTVDWPGIEG